MWFCDRGTVADVADIVDECVLLEGNHCVRVRGRLRNEQEQKDDTQGALLLLSGSFFSEGISRQETALNCVQPVCRASPWKQPCKQEIRCGMTLAALYHMDCEVLIKTQ
jgi:hypothetical protein